MSQMSQNIYSAQSDPLICTRRSMHSVYVPWCPAYSQYTHGTGTRTPPAGPGYVIVVAVEIIPLSIDAYGELQWK